MSFKVGDKVQLIDQMKYRGNWTGPMEVKFSHPHMNGWVDVEHPTMGHGTISESTLELVPAPSTTPKFKPGDFVQLKDQKSHRGTCTGPMIVIAAYVSGNTLCEHPVSGCVWYTESELEFLPSQPLQSGISTKQINTLSINFLRAIDTNIPATIKCECGAEASGFTSHSSWCPKHESLSASE